MPRLRDLTGQTFGRWTVLKRSENEYTSGGTPKVMWLCKCSCEKGTIKAVSANSLTSGKSKSCGCLNLERIKEPKLHLRKDNFYDMDSYKYGVGIDSNGNQFIFDKEDYELISQFCWHKHHGYWEAKDIRLSSNKTIFLHKLLMNCEYAGRRIKVDHQDGNPDNNQKENLRKATTSQNNKNRKSWGKSGVTGVLWHKKHNRWEVYLNKKYIGSSKDYAEAIRMRVKAEKEHYGEFGFFESRKIDVEQFIIEQQKRMEEEKWHL